MGVRQFRMALVLVSLVAGLLAGGAGFDATPSPDRSNQSVRVVPGEIIVGLVDGADVALVARGVSATAVEPLLGGNTFVFSVAGDPFGKAAQARGLSGVRYAEPNYVRTLHVAPNDSDFWLKWDLHNDGGTLSDGSDSPTAGADIDFLRAYEALQGKNFSETFVAILDTGIDASHPDLNDKLVLGKAFDAFDGDNNPEDGFGHGTHVAGIAAAESNNSTGTTGVGFPAEVKIMPVKVCDDNGSCPTSAIVAGVEFAMNNGAKVINMSFGSSEPSQVEKDAFDAAHGAGVLLVASAGNSNVSTMNYPAAYESVMAIAATDWDDQKASYSNYGSWVNLAAPGGDMDKYDDPEGIYSTMPGYNVYLTSCRARGLLSPCYEQNYDQLAGTSMAAPQVAGAAGLLFAINSSLSNDAVRFILEDTAERRAGTENLWANGRLALYDAVLRASDGSIDAAPTVSISSPSDGAAYSSGKSISFAGSATDTEDGDLTANLIWTSDLDGQIGTGGSFSATLSDGTHLITASITDSGGNQGSDSISVSVGGVDTGDITLAVNAYKVRGLQHADLAWSGATSIDVDVFRNGSHIATTPNDGAYTDGPLGRGGGSATYQICEAGTSTCSSEVTANW